MNFIAKNIDTYAAPLKGFGNSEISVNENYISKGNKPLIPVMGELHFSRVTEKDWERELIKMKKEGIEVVSCYLFGFIMKKAKVSLIGAIIEICINLLCFAKNMACIFSCVQYLEHLASVEMVDFQIGFKKNVEKTPDVIKNHN